MVVSNKNRIFALQIIISNVKRNKTYTYNNYERKRVYTFGNGKAEGNAQMREVLGGKGANLAEMNLIGVPVPPGFTITTDTCNEYYEVGEEKSKNFFRTK
ncbi:MAG: PEP/pyruvate-binding domain-containing protein [Segatella copri]